MCKTRLHPAGLLTTVANTDIIQMATRRIAVLRYGRLIQPRISQGQPVPGLQKQIERQQSGRYQESGFFRPLKYSICVPCRWKKTAAQTTNPPPPEPENTRMSTAKRAALRIGVPLATGVAAVGGAPLVLSAMGFGAGGIVAGSCAASIMSCVGTTGFGAVVLACAQSAGAAGFSAAGNVLLAGGGAAIGEAAVRVIRRGRTRPPADEGPRGPNRAQGSMGRNGPEGPRGPNENERRSRDPPPPGN